MTSPPPDWPRALALLDLALALPLARRETWLAQTAASDPLVAPLLRKLLLAHGRVETHEILATLPKLQRTKRTSDAGTAGLRVGPFELLEPLGRGGMGSVWRARYADGRLKRDVAVKLPASTEDPTALHNLRERFARERDFLAQLEHPHIARLYDAGVSDSGQPYLAMEYVAGLPIDAHCDAQRLPIKARLNLFSQVLDAVGHAHQQLVLHRDLKSSNVLVDDKGQVRLLDFGVARLLPTPQTADTDAQQGELTERAGAAFTLGHAAPEQVNHGPLSTATDVYALGVMLYRLLTGLSPYQPARDTRGALEDAVLLATPEAASTRLFAPEALAARQTSSGELRKALRDDLDVILGKAMKKSPQERYATVTALTDDLQRHLAQQPISAHADSGWYRMRLFVARNRVAVTASSLAVLTLMGTAGTAVWQAQVSARNAAQAAKEAARANTAQKFFAGLLSKADPEQNKSITAVDKQVVEQALINAEKYFADAPETLMLILKQLGDVYSHLGMPAKSLQVHKKRIALLERMASAPPEELIDAQLALGQAFGKSESGAERSQALAVLMSAHQKAMGLADRPELVVRAHCLLADQLVRESKYEDADAFAAQAVAHAEKTLVPSHASRASAYAYRAATATWLGDFGAAREAHQKATLVDAMGPGRSEVELLNGRASLARIEYLDGHYALAKREALAALDDASQRLGPMEGTLTPLRLRAIMASLKAGQLDDAEQLVEKLLVPDLTSGDSFRAGRAHFAKALVAMHRGKHDAAVRSFDAAEAGLARSAWWRRNLALEQATLTLRRGQLTEARRQFNTLIESLREAGEMGSEEFAFAAQRMAVVLVKEGQLAPAHSLFKEACARGIAKLRTDHPNRIRCDAYATLISETLTPHDQARALADQIKSITANRDNPLALTTSLQQAVEWVTARLSQETPESGRYKNFPLLD
jgi:serine/threonine protein kinase/tetratricopeptide (TPR) repeat protein